MAVSDYNADPGLNLSISGINIAEGCAPSGINDAIRQLMADVKVESAAQSAAAAGAKNAADAASGQVSALDTSLRALIAQEVGDAEAAASAQVSSLDGTLRALVASEASTREASVRKAMPAGAIVAFAANAAPEGFLLCNGAAVSRTTYAALFAAIGATYGAGNGSTTFHLPNLTDRFLQGSGTAGAVKGAGLPDITGAFISGSQSAFASSSQVHGAFYVATAVSKHTNAISGVSATGYPMGFAASRSNAIYGASATVQPPAVTMRFYIKF